MYELIFTLDKKNTDSLGSIRSMPGLQLAADENDIWLRGLYETGELDITIRQLPIKHSYYVNEHDLLFIPGGLTAVAVLPALNWQPIAEFISVKIPVAAMPGKLHTAAVIRVIPSTHDKKGTALLTTLEQWKAYAETAPGIRLAQLQFAVSQKNEVMIIGTPLPSIPGKEYWKTGNILLPCGYDLEIPMAASFISQQLNPEQDGLLIFDTNGGCEKIEFAYLVPAKRSAVRLTSITN